MTRALTFLIGVCGGALAAAAARPAAAQVLEYKAGTIVAYPHAEANNEFLKKARWGRDPSAMLSLYAGVYRGAAGTLDSLTIDPSVQALQVNFPTLHFVISAASRIQSEIGESQLGNHLRRLNAHVQLTPLDSARRPITDASALEVIGVQPNSIEAVPPADTTPVDGRMARVMLASRVIAPSVLGFLGPRAAAVATHFHNSGLRLTAPTQVSYLSASSEFGWTWYEHAKQSIEGIHRTAALLQLSPNVRYVQAHIELITDWKYHGTWMKPFDVVVDVSRPVAR
jgi:hypothetical protein